MFTPANKTMYHEVALVTKTELVDQTPTDFSPLSYKFPVNQLSCQSLNLKHMQHSFYEFWTQF